MHLVSQHPAKSYCHNLWTCFLLVKVVFYNDHVLSLDRYKFYT
ncbi:hypothetical protein ZEAMMB73_Zm00001d051022 [Zea mays]|uniref:Uncharacterized protein n=1 Tax=Zea mays TaxID=4577 RepID=A0A1D6Q4J1_MAIZE|nr:hypothetical protein ZEAMMB73_Zm00001d051022 [Zea mays]AQK53476.1 hypothetical protein ZEAMMB73_Zm00001d051022 [Zea mays]